jgi:hypothetical protein
MMLAGWSLVGNAANLALAKGARVGILNLLDPDITHYHLSRDLEKSFLKTQYVGWRIDLMLAGAVRDRVEQMGLVEVPVSPTDALARGREHCFLNSPLAKGLPRECAPPFAQLAAQERLDAIIVLGPGLNDSAHGRRRKELPEYLRGWGFVTRAEGGARTSLFNMTELLLVGINGEAVTLGGREWGGGYELDWADFDAQPDLKVLPGDVLDKLEPLFSDILRRQSGRLLDQVDTR